MAKSIQELHDPATLDVLLLMNIEIRDALFLNLTQIKSEQLQQIMGKNAFLPSAIAYLLVPAILVEERESEKVAVSIINSIISEQQMGKYMERYNPRGVCSPTDFLIGAKRLISLSRMAKWIMTACNNGTVNLDVVKWELVMEKPVAHSELMSENDVSTGKH